MAIRRPNADTQILPLLSRVRGAPDETIMSLLNFVRPAVSDWNFDAQLTFYLRRLNSLYLGAMLRHWWHTMISWPN